MTSVATCLYCEHCGREEVHEIRYVGTLIAAISCAHCGTHQASAPFLVRDYLIDVERRVAHKPAKVLRAAVDDPRRFLVGLPESLATKPARIAAELEEVARLELAPWLARVRPVLRRRA